MYLNARNTSFSLGQQHECRIYSDIHRMPEEVKYDPL